MLVLVIFSLFLWNACDSTAITHVDSIFEVFSARSLIKFFEFNSSGFNLTNNCGKEIFIYLEALQKDQLWAIKRKYY